MTPLLVLFLITLGLSILPNWLTRSILKKQAQQEGVLVWDWIPFAFLPYAIGEFKHRSKFAIIWGYVFGELLFYGSLAAVVLIWYQGRQAV